ncbi:MAG: leucine-rich repeat protein [Clostridia bacterium]|nr:leucine-rich repeat protein [Clostridia bacterium]
MKRKFTLTFALIALLSLVFAFQSGALSEDRPYTESDTIKIVDHVVYELVTRNKETFYSVTDYFDTNEIAETATEINIVSEIDGIPVKHISTGRSDGFEGPADYEIMPNITKINIPDSITHIGSASFSGLINFETIELPDSVESIGHAFYNMKNLRSVTIPEKETTIGDYAFWGCKKLEEVIFKGDITEICDGAFSGCISLKEIKLPDSLESILDAAFSGSGLESVYLPRVGIGECAFDNCKSLKKVVVEDRGTCNFASFSYAAFAGCENLEKVYIKSGEIFINESAFHKCNKLTDVYVWVSPEKWGKLFGKDKFGDENFSGNEPLFNASMHFYYKHTHSFTTSDKPATCLKTGTRTFTCACGDSESYCLPKSGHSYSVWKVNKAPTKKADGTIKRTCTVCTKSQTKVVKYGFIPSKTSSITFESTTRQITLTWKAVPGATGYRVYRYNPTTGKYVKLKNTSKTTYTATGLIHSYPYKFAVKAYAKIDGKTYWATKYRAINTATLPEKPVIKTHPGMLGDPLVGWPKLNLNNHIHYSNNQETEKHRNPVNYTLYRSTKKDSGFKKILEVYREDYEYKMLVHPGNSIVTVNHLTSDFLYFKDKKLKNGTYYYKVVAYVTVDGKNIYGEFSDTVSFTVNK